MSNGSPGRAGGFGVAALRFLFCLGLMAVSSQARSDGLVPAWDQWQAGLKDQGVDLQLNYGWEGAANITGGTHDTAAEAGQLTLGASGDLGKLLNWQDGLVQVTITHRNGTNLNADAGINALEQIQEVYGRGDIWRLTQLWLDQGFFHNAFDVKAGRLTVGEDFATFSCDFENLTFCGSLPGNVVGDYWFNWPVSEWGARVKFGLAQQGYIALGAYQNNPANLRNGFSFDVGHGNGGLFVGEGAWTPTWHGLAGSYKLGAWYDSATTAEILQTGAVTPPSAPAALNWRGRTGLYGLLQQRITGDPKGQDGITLFLNATQADRLTSEFDRELAVGASDGGFWQARPKDVVALAFGINHAANRLADAPDNGAQAQRAHSEYVIELDYQLEPLAGLTLRPNFQEILSPGGKAAAPDAAVFGLKASLVP